CHVSFGCEQVPTSGRRNAPTQPLLKILKIPAGGTRLQILVLFTQVHASVLIQLPEVWVAQVFNKSNSFSRRFHLRSKLSTDPRKFFKTKNRFFDSEALEFFIKRKIFELVSPDHDLGSNI